MNAIKIAGPALLAVLMTGASLTPALAQNRFMDQARDAAARREENRIIREAEHPEQAPAAPATQAAQAAPAPAEAAPAAAEAAPVEPAAPAEPAAVPAPAPN